MTSAATIGSFSGFDGVNSVLVSFCIALWVGDAWKSAACRSCNPPQVFRWDTPRRIPNHPTDPACKPAYCLNMYGIDCHINVVEATASPFIRYAGNFPSMSLYG